MKVIRHAVCLTKPVKGETLHWSDNWKQRVICWRAWSSKIIILPCRYCTCTYSIYILYKWNIRTRYSFGCTLVSVVTNVQASRYMWLESTHFICLMFQHVKNAQLVTMHRGPTWHAAFHVSQTCHIQCGGWLYPLSWQWYSFSSFLWVIYVINKWLRCQ